MVFRLFLLLPRNLTALPSETDKIRFAQIAYKALYPLRSKKLSVLPGSIL